MVKIKNTLKSLPIISKTILLLALFISLNLDSSAQNKYDLVIKNAKVFDSRSGKLASNQTILINGNIITNVTSSKTKYPGTKTIDAAGKLVTPGFIDTHIHPTDVYRTYGPLPEYLPKDSLDIYRKRISDTFLPYGVTSAMIMGHSEKWLQPILSWQNNPLSNSLDLLTVGGAFVSNEGRKPYINHVIVNSPEDARQKVKEYYNLGMRHIKLYWKLRRPEFEAAFKTADSLGMRVYGHVDQNVMFIDTALDIGVRNYEHMLTLVNTVLNLKKNGNEFKSEMEKYYAPGASKNGQLERLEMFRYVHDKNPEAIPALLDKLAKDHATFSTSIHLMAEPFGLTYFSNGLDNSLTPEQLARCKENVKIFMGYVKQAFDKGVKLRIGTDWPNGGKAIISEQLLLSEYGFTIPQILQISTINGAVALGSDNKYGSIEKGKKADILIWEKSPYDDYKNFLAKKTIIKDGIVFEK